MNKIWNSLYSLPTKRAIENNQSRRVNSSGNGFAKIEAILTANNLYILDNRTWYSVGDNRNGHSVPNNDNGIFATLSEVREWIKKDMNDYLKMVS
jgi:hypothetical protein